MRRLMLAAILMAVVPFAMAMDVATFVRRDQFEDIRLSPTGEYLAMTVPTGDKTVLAILRRSDKQIVGRFSLAGKAHVHDFWWVSPTRVVLNMAERSGGYDTPYLTGELYAVDADGSAAKMLVGYRAGDDRGGSRLKQRAENVVAWMVDDLPGNDDEVIVSVSPWNESRSVSYATAERLDVRSGRRTTITKAPVRDADYFTDLAGEIRFAHGADDHGKAELYYRDGSGEWKLIHEQARTGTLARPVGFAADNRIAYLLVGHDEGPDSIVAYDTVTGERKEVFRDDDSDPYWLIRDPATRALVGVGLMDGKARMVFFDEKSGTARFYRSLEAAFGGQTVRVESATADGQVVLVEVLSDRNPGDFYVFDRRSKQADYVISRGASLDPERLGERVPIALKARDGLALTGYVTYPVGAPRTKLPMVVLPHGGPNTKQDIWWYDSEAQLLAAHGYAVLQLNFRGSSGRGKAFEVAGYGQWGRAMQDDLTDATRWAIAQGIADPARICIYGGSYGGYAALMGVAKEPDLYRCAAGTVGVYDLPMLFGRGDLSEKDRTRNFLRDSVGTAGLEEVSPVRLAGRIKVPVFLAAGGEDERAPIEHTKRMEQALKAAGRQVESLYYPNEGHGFYDDGHRVEFYAKLLSFLARNIGGKPPAMGAASQKE